MDDGRRGDWGRGDLARGWWEEKEGKEGAGKAMTTSPGPLSVQPSLSLAPSSSVQGQLPSSPAVPSTSVKEAVSVTPRVRSRW